MLRKLILLSLQTHGLHKLLTHIWIRLPIMNIKNLQMLYFDHWFFNVVCNLQNVTARNTRSFIQQTITFQEALTPFLGDIDLIHIRKDGK
jgi:hypothetical protein